MLILSGPLWPKLLRMQAETIKETRVVYTYRSWISEQWLTFVFSYTRQVPLIGFCVTCITCLATTGTSRRGKSGSGELMIWAAILQTDASEVRGGNRRATGEQQVEKVQMQSYLKTAQKCRYIYWQPLLGNKAEFINSNEGPLLPLKGWKFFEFLSNAYGSQNVTSCRSIFPS